MNLVGYFLRYLKIRLVEKEQYTNQEIEMTYTFLAGSNSLVTNNQIFFVLFFVFITQAYLKLNRKYLRSVHIH